MKKSSLLGLSLVSLVSLVACNQAPAKSQGQSAMEKLYSFIVEKPVKELKGSKTSAVLDEDDMFDVYSDENDKYDYFKVEGSKDSWEACFVTYGFTFENGGYFIEEEGEKYGPFTLTQINIINNNIMYDLFVDEDGEYDLPVDKGNWACASLYDEYKVDEETDEVEIMSGSFLNCAKTMNPDDATLYVVFYSFLKEFQANDGSSVFYSFVDMLVYGKADLQE